MGERSWLRMGDACRMLGVSRSTLLAAEEAGLIAAVRTPGGHRRFAVNELERFRRGTVRAPDGALEPPEPGSQPVRLVTDVRTALRELVQLLDGVCAGVYLLDREQLRYCSGFGIPRWQADHLAVDAPPEPVVAALTAVRPRTVAADALVSRPRGGQGLAIQLAADGEALGVMFLVTRADHELLPGELRIIAAAQRMVALLIDRLRCLADAEHRLARVRELSGSPASGTA